MVLASISDIHQKFDVTTTFCRSKAPLTLLPVESEEMQNDDVVLVSDDEHEPCLQHRKDDAIHVSPISKFSVDSRVQMANINNENSSKIRLFYQMARLHLKRECPNIGCRQINYQIKLLEQRCEKHDLLLKCATREHTSMIRRIELVSAENARLTNDKQISSETKLQMDFVIRHQQKTICEQDAKLAELNKFELRENLLSAIPTPTLNQSAYNNQKIAIGNASRTSVTPSSLPSSRVSSTNRGSCRSGNGISVSALPMDKRQTECESLHLPRTQNNSFAPTMNGHLIPNSTKHNNGFRKELSQSSLASASSCNRPIGRMVVEVPLLDNLKEINEPKSMPPMDYPIALRQIRLKSGRGNLEILVHTQAADFHLSNKIQGIIRYPQNIDENLTQTICLYYYMESAVTNRKLDWMRGPVCICRSTGSTKFCLQFHKDQKNARYDRVIIFVYMFSDVAKYVSDRAVFEFAPLQISSLSSKSPPSNVLMCNDIPENILQQESTQKLHCEENFQVYRPRF